MRLEGGFSRFQSRRAPRLLSLATASALILAVLAEFETFELPNGLLFDLAAGAAGGGDPSVLVVRAAQGQEFGTEAALRRRGMTTLQVVGSSAGDVEAVAPRLGVTRRVQLSDRAERLVLLPGAAVMPVLTSEQILSGAVPAETLKGVLALIAPAIETDPPRMLTSAVGSPPEIGMADFLARAHHAQRIDRLVREVAGLPRALLLIAASLLFALLAPRVKARHVPGATGVIAISVLLIGMAMITVAGLLLPITEIAVLSLVTGAAAMAQAKAVRDEKLALLADRAGSFTSRHSLLTDQRRWVDFFPAAMRVTGIKSGLLIEEQPDDSFVVRAAVTGGAEDEPPLPRRQPCFDRADERRPEPVPADDLDGWTGGWIARLDENAEGRLYWLFRFSPGETDLVLPAARRLARRVSELPILNGSARRSSAAADIDARLFGSFSGLLARSSELRQSLGSLRTATMLFDGAGIPLQINEAMERLLRAARLNPARATPVDVASALAGLDAETARGMLGELIRRGGDLRLNPQAPVGGRHYGVRVTEVDGDLLFEATDVTDLQRLAELQRELAGDIDVRIRNDLEAIELATRLASDERLPQERRSRSLAMIGEAASRTRGTLGNLARLVDASIYSSASAPYPVNPRSALIQAAGGLKRVADQRGVRIDLRQPALAALVLAEPLMLDGLIRAMLLIPLSDSERGSAVTADLSEGEQFTELQVTGGFGLPSARFARAVEGLGSDTAEPLRLLGDAKAVIATWGAELEASSSAGQGYRLLLRMRKDER